MVVCWFSRQLVRRTENVVTHTVKLGGKSDIRYLSDTVGITLEKFAVN